VITTNTWLVSVSWMYIEWVNSKKPSFSSYGLMHETVNPTMSEIDLAYYQNMARGDNNGKLMLLIICWYSPKKNVGTQCCFLLRLTAAR
jgi:hypothetical protein